MVKKFIIAHLSDLHITAQDNDSRYELAMPNDKLKGMNYAFQTLLSSKSIQNVDHIIITGDITDEGELKAWKKFDTYLKTAKLDQKTSFVIGNHDICNMGEINLGITRKQKWERIRRARTVLKKRLSSINQKYDYPWAKTLRDDIVLFGIDSNNAASSTDITNAIGEIGQKQLSKFATLLRKNAHSPVKIVALHHSPNLAEKSAHVAHLSCFEKRFTRYTHQIPQDQRRSLRYMCESHGVKRLIHGHMHEKHDRTLNIRTVGVPSSTQPILYEKKYYLEYVEYHITTSKTGEKRVRNVWKKIPITHKFEKLTLVEFTVRYLLLRAKIILSTIASLILFK